MTPFSGSIRGLGWLAELRKALDSLDHHLLPRVLKVMSQRPDKDPRGTRSHRKQLCPHGARALARWWQKEACSPPRQRSPAKGPRSCPVRAGASPHRHGGLRLQPSATTLSLPAHSPGGQLKVPNLVFFFPIVCFLHYCLSSLCSPKPPPPCSPHTVVRDHESVFFLAPSLPPTPPKVPHL